MIRELTQQLEDNAAQLRTEMEAEKATINKKYEADLKEFRRQRSQQEVRAQLSQPVFPITHQPECISMVATAAQA